MKQKRVITLGKALFALSFLFIFTGLYINFEERGSFSDPFKDTTLISDGGKVIISTTDDTVDEGDFSEELTDKDSGSSENETLLPPASEDIPNPPEVAPNPVPTPEPTPEVKPPVEVVQPPQSTEKPSTDVKPSENVPTAPKVEEPVVTPTIEDTNNILRKRIEDTYGVEIKYGNETDGYTAGTMKSISITDSNVVKSGLEQLNTTLALYPKNFFREFGESNLNLKIYLLQRYETANVTGITELYGNDVTISVSMDFPFAESFHHETYHYIEHFIEKKGGKFSIWNTYNPIDFAYGGTADPKLSFNRTWTPDVPFVNNYAQSDEDEDRASTFEYMTASSKATCYNSTEYPIWKKSSYVALMIDTYFDTVDPSVIDYWERFIY